MATAQDPARTTPQETFVDAQIAHARGRIRAHDVGVATLALAVAALAFAVGMVLLDRAFEFSDLTRQLALGAFALAAVGYAAFAFSKPFRRQVNPYYAARLVERSLPGAKNSVVNWLDLRDEPLPPAVHTALGQRAARDLRQADVDAVVRDPRVNWLGWAAGLLFAAAVVQFLVLKPGPYASLLSRAFRPFTAAAIAKRTSLELVKPAGGNALVAVNRSIDFEVRVGGTVPAPGADDAVRLRLRYNPADPAYEDKAFVPDPADARRWALRLPASQVQNGFSYRVVGGDDATDEYTVGVRSTPLVEAYDVLYRYRPYLQFRDLETHNPNLEARRGTRVTLTAHTNRVVEKGSVVFDAADGRNEPPKPPVAGVPVDGQPNALRFEFEIERDAKYRVHFQAKDGETNEDPLPHTIAAQADFAPQVDVTRPAPDRPAPEPLPVNGSLTVAAKASDDIGVTAVRLVARLRRGGPGGKPQPLQPKKYRNGKSFRFADGTFPRTLDVVEVLPLDELRDELNLPAAPKKGDLIEYWLEADDNCDYPNADTGKAPNTGRSRVLTAVVADPIAEEEKKERNDAARQEKAEHEQRQDADHRKQDGEKKAGGPQNPDAQGDQPRPQGDQKPQGANDQKPGGERDPNKPGAGQPGEGKPGEGKPGEGKPGEGKPGEGQPGEGKPDAPPPGGGEKGNENPDEKRIEDIKRKVEKELRDAAKGDAKPDGKPNDPNAPPKGDAKPDAAPQPGAGNKGDAKPDAAPKGEKPEGGAGQPMGGDGPPEKGEAKPDPVDGDAPPGNDPNKEVRDATKPREKPGDAKLNPGGQGGEPKAGDQPNAKSQPDAKGAEPKPGEPKAGEQPGDAKPKAGANAGQGKNAPQPGDARKTESGQPQGGQPKPGDKQGKAEPKPGDSPGKAEPKQGGGQGKAGTPKPDGSSKPEGGAPKGEPKPSPGKGEALPKPEAGKGAGEPKGGEPKGDAAKANGKQPGASGTDAGKKADDGGKSSGQGKPSTAPKGQGGEAGAKGSASEQPNQGPREKGSDSVPKSKPKDGEDRNEGKGQGSSGQPSDKAAPKGMKAEDGTGRSKAGERVVEKGEAKPDPADGDAPPGDNPNAELRDATKPHEKPGAKPSAEPKSGGAPAGAPKPGDAKPDEGKPDEGKPGGKQEPNERDASGKPKNQKPTTDDLKKASEALKEFAEDLGKMMKDRPPQEKPDAGAMKDAAERLKEFAKQMEDLKTSDPKAFDEIAKNLDEARKNLEKGGGEDLKKAAEEAAKAAEEARKAANEPKPELPPVPGQPGSKPGDNPPPPNAPPGPGQQGGPTGPGGDGTPDNTPGDAPDPRNLRRAGELQLEQFKKVDKSTLERLKMTEAEYKQFLAEYEALLKRKAAPAPAAKDDRQRGEAKGGSAANTKARQVKGGPEGKSKLERGGAAQPPPEFRDGYKGFTEDVSKTPKPAEKK